MMRDEPIDDSKPYEEQVKDCPTLELKLWVIQELSATDDCAMWLVKLIVNELDRRQR